MKKFYPVAEPYLTGNEKKYVLQCLDENWISSRGKFIPEFENQFATFCNRSFGIATSNGTVSLHLILHSLGITAGDEVIVPALTYAASLNVILHTGARPVLVDIDPYTFNLDPAALEAVITPRTKAIMVVHLYGNPCDMRAIEKIAKAHNLLIIEDAAEAHGALYREKPIGSFGVASSFSFFGNKTITTGEGGMVLTNKKSLAEKLSLFKNQGQHHKKPSYYHSVPGFNYRMTNIAAAIGLAQLEQIHKLLTKKRKINSWYKKALAPLITQNKLMPQQETAESDASYWMNAFLVPHMPAKRLMKRLLDEGIETRPFFVPMHKLPYTEDIEGFPQAEYVHTHGVIFPSGANLTKHDIAFIADRIAKHV